MERWKLTEVVTRLAKLHGPPNPPPSKDPWLLVLRENVAYLADDARRNAAFDTLRKRIGTKPDEILAASDAALLEVTGHGILAATFAEKLRRCARIALLEWPLARTKKSLARFPGIGTPGAEKILLFARAEPVLALESNGLRVLTRIGFAAEQKSYASTYRLVRAAVEPELAASRRDRESDFDRLIAAHQLLRRHGQEVCKCSAPKCGECPLRSGCRHGRDLAGGG